jgi:hypothetical protein
MAEAVPDLVFLESGWGILTALGVANVLYGLTVMSITKFSRIILILIIVSAAGALANALCYYAFYTNAPPSSSAAASGTSDILWLVSRESSGDGSSCLQLLTRRGTLSCNRYKKWASRCMATSF